MSLDRSVLKAQYEKFCRAWRDERLFQDITLKSGRELPDGVNKLGKKPTFRMWAKAMENQKQAALQAPPEKAVVVKDATWEE